MSTRLTRVTMKISLLKRELAALWEAKQRTDEEVLSLAVELDLLLNEYDALKRAADDLTEEAGNIGDERSPIANYLWE